METADNAPSPSGAAVLSRVLGGRYEVLETLNEGPLLTAYRARDRAQNRIVTVKALRPAFAGRADVVDALRTGLGQTLALTHNSITRALDVGTDDETGTVYFVEEHVRGIDLRERIRRAAPFQLSAAVETAIALAEGLEFAQERGVVHGDVRPRNVLVGPEGQVKLTDFGVARAQRLALGDDPQFVKRVAPYAPPDGDPNPSGDLYGLGVLLYEMLTGGLPAPDAAAPAEDGTGPSPRQVNAGVPVALDGLVRKALAASPAVRYASATELLRDLRAVRDGLRYGRSLAWTPLDPRTRPAPAAPPAGGGEDRTTPTVSVPTVPPPMSSPASPPADGESVTPPAFVQRAVTTVPLPPTNAPSVMPAGGGAGGGAAPYTAVAAALRQEEDDNLPPVRPSGSRWLAFVNLFLGLLLVGALAALLYMAAEFLKPVGEVVVPNLVGKRLADAKTLGIQQKFEIKVVDEEFRDKEPNGVVFKMGLNPGSRIKQGKAIPVWVSKGPRMVEVPDVRDMTFDKARRILEVKGLRLGNYKGEYDSLAPKGTVLRQLPEPGENRARGTKIDIIISRGEEPVAPLPDSFGSPADAAAPTPDPQFTPEVSPDATPTPAATPTPTPAASGGEGRKRYFDIAYDIPDDGDRHRIRVDVLDDRGARTVYDSSRRAGGRVERTVEAVGARISIKVYDNDELRSELSK